ncbi:MAG: twin-arginine translocation signal domain-containing protein, partial [Saprospiraceae bacterium]
MNKITDKRARQMNRRAFLSKSAIGIGAAALSSILGTYKKKKRESGLLVKEPMGVQGVLDQL